MSQTKMTITEALAEVKLIDAKIEKKQEVIKQNLLRFEHTPDQFESKGGAKDYFKTELQSIKDLQERLITFRCKINVANLTEPLTINDVTRTVAAWIVWKREVSNKKIEFANTVIVAMNSKRQEQAQRPMAYKDEKTGENKFAKLIYNLDETELMDDRAKTAELLGVLDGRLSVFNATTTIEI